MRHLLPLILAALLAPLTAAADSGTMMATWSSTQTGIAGDALASPGVTSEPLDCTPGGWGGSIVSYQATVVVGTTSTVTVSCQESVDEKYWVWLPFCTNAAASACTKQTLVFTLADFTTYHGAGFAVTLHPRARYVRCTFLGDGVGTGTITATATRVSP